MIFGGIDTGSSTGAIAFLDNDGVPILTQKFTTWAKIYPLLEPYRRKDFIFISCEHSQGYKGMGLKSTCSFLKNAGGWETLLEVFEIPHVLTHSRTWQAKLLGKFPKGESKKAAFAYAKRRWPSFGLKGTESEEGIIDALCISDFARLTFRA